jgi:hypothetical protein
MRLRAERPSNATTAKTATNIDGPATQSTAARLRISRAVVRCVLCGLCVLNAACGNTSLFRQYEYEEDLYLSLDGSATLYVNSSIAALNALRGTSFDASPASRVDTSAVRAYYTTPGTQVSRISPFRRSNRRFVSVRIDVDDVRRLGQAAPFAWSTYRFEQTDHQYTYLQTVGAAGGSSPGNAGWNGRELVAFRLHLPSKIRYHNTRGVESRGNILAWEQPLADRLRGDPLSIEARMDTQSILYRTLWLFGMTVVVVAAAFAAVIWWVMRRGAEPPVAPAR